MIPHLYNRSFTISADLDIPAAGAEGVIVAESDVMGGFSLYVQDGKLRYTYSFLGVKVETLTASETLPMGKIQVRYEFAADEPGKPATGGRGRLFVGDKQVGENHMEHTVPLRFTTYAGMDIGKDNGEPVSLTYKARSPFPFTGKIGKVVFDRVQTVWLQVYGFMLPQGVGWDLAPDLHDLSKLKFLAALLLAPLMKASQSPLTSMHRSSNTASARSSIHLIPLLSNRSPTTYRAAPSTTPWRSPGPPSATGP